MKFHKKAIIGTLFFIIIYMLLANLNTPNEPGSFQFQKDLEISFSSITSIGALFWSLYALYRFQNMANFENLIQDTVKNISKFKDSMGDFNKLLKLPMLTNIMSSVMGEDEEDNNNQKIEDIEKKYLLSDKPDLELKKNH